MVILINNDFTMNQIWNKLLYENIPDQKTPVGNF